MGKWTRCWMLGTSLLLACSDESSDRRQDADDGGARRMDGSTPSRTDAKVSPSRDAGSNADASACNHAELTFDPRPPATFLLVDQSSSMFDNGRWTPLKTGVLSVVQQLSTEVRFGFASYTGKNGGTCPDMTQVALADDNYAAIAAAYNALGAPPYKGETPTASALAQAARWLADSSESGAKSIVLVTDGEPDFCDDGNVTCARDAVIAAVQAAHAQGIRTFILSIGGQVSQAHLRDVANAGVGQGVIDHGGAVANQCPGRKASYGSSEGDAPYFEPDVSDQQALAEVLAGVVVSTRSCVLDLAGRVRVDLDQASAGTVTIDDRPVPYGTADGFRMNSPTELELLGSACERIRTSQAVRIAVDYPCEAIIFL